MQRANLQPIYKQLKEKIINEIRVGRFQVGQSLPSERELEEAFSVSRMTVRKALSELATEDIIEKSHGKRSTINELKNKHRANMAFVTVVPEKIIPDLYLVCYDYLLKICHASGINLFHVQINEPLPDFISEIKFEAIFISGNIRDRSLIDGLVRPKTKLVALDNVFEQSTFTTVCTDNHHGGALAAKTLIEKGCKKLLALGVEPAYKYLPFRERKGGFIKEVNKSMAEYSILDIDEDKPDLLCRELGEHIKRRMPDGIFAFNDHLAITVINALTRLGIKVPDDISVIGFDGLDYGEFAIVPLTTIAQPVVQICETAMEIVKSDTFPLGELIELPGNLITRKSC